ncbi:MAG: SlyX family protein [Proteobacteria bacterium]|nr:SlyX family protein [Pseudomonadota bacterium]
MEKRIVDLEMRFMHQQSTIQELNEVVIAHQKSIDELKSEVDRLKRQVGAGAESLIRDPSEETAPPHF